jgi:predicted nucleic acid-binding protein
MISSNFLTDPRPVLVADASVVINLNATACARAIIAALPNGIIVTENACLELEAGAKNGHDDARQLRELIDIGLVRRVQLGTAATPVYETLIDGSAFRTLDDGEAATIALAVEAGGVALIDERKARSLCASAFPGLILSCTAELLMHGTVAAALGTQGQIDALVSALTLARMRVPLEYLAQVTALIGIERAAMCTSLPKAAREVAG